MQTEPTEGYPIGAPCVVLYGYYGSRNLGDDLLLAVMLERLRAMMPGARFLVRDHGHLLDDGALGDDVAAVPVEVLLADQSRGKAIRLLDYLAGWRRILRRADWLVIGGGTVFHARGSNRALLLQTLIFRMARHYRVGLVALGVGVSDLPDARSRRLLSAIVRTFDAFLVRDEAGLSQCAGSKAERGGDLVFGWRGMPALAASASGERPAVGLTVYPPACQDPAVIDNLRRAVMRLQAAGHRVVFLVFQRAGAAEGDDGVFARIATGLDGERRPEVRTLTADPAALAAGLADIGMMAGMRFHGLVLGAMRGQPFVGLAHDNKISDLCQRLGMPCLDLGLDRVADIADGLAHAVTAAWQLRLDPATLAAEKDAAEVNFRRLAEIMAGARAPTRHR